jgi:DNA primase
MAFPDSFVEEVRRTADIVRYVSEHVSLRKMGTSWKGLCPFHQEKTPSFNVRQEPPLFHCFGCGEGGDVFKFVMLHERVGFPEAIEAVARRFGIPIPENRFEAGPDRKERDQLLALLEAAAEHFTSHFWGGPGTRAREYLLGRGFQKETLEKIRAGAAPDAWTDLGDSLRRKFEPSSLIKAGLVIEGQQGKRPYDRFRNRVIFPITSDAGKVVAFGARSLDGSEPKYLNSPESPVYQKSRTLYGLSWAKDGIRTAGRVVLMEGYLDVARAVEAGVTEAVATCGTALTAGHARLLRRFTERVVVNFDQDDAGQKAARKSLDILVEEGLKAHVVELPEGHDPDTFVKAEGVDAYRRALDEAPPYMEWLIRRSAAENDTRTPAGKGAYLNALLPSLRRIESAVERAAWFPAIIQRGGLDAQAAQEELRRALASRSPTVAAAAMAPAVPAPRPAVLLPAERLLVALVLADAEGAGEALDGLDDADIQGLRAAQVLAAARALRGRGERVTAAGLEAVLEEDARRMVREVAVEPPVTDGVDPAECARELRRLPLRTRMAEIQRDLPQARGQAEEELLEEKLRLKRRMAEL